jgi:hypothetical protein
VFEGLETIVLLGSNLGVQEQLFKAEQNYKRALADYKAWTAAEPSLPQYDYQRCGSAAGATVIGGGNAASGGGTTIGGAPPTPPPPASPYKCRTKEVGALIAQLDGQIAAATAARDAAQQAYDIS